MRWFLEGWNLVGWSQEVRKSPKLDIKNQSTAGYHMQVQSDIFFLAFERCFLSGQSTVDLAEVTAHHWLYLAPFEH